MAAATTMTTTTAVATPTATMVDAVGKVANTICGIGRAVAAASLAAATQRWQWQRNGSGGFVTTEAAP